MPDQQHKDVVYEGKFKHIQNLLARYKLIDLVSNSKFYRIKMSPKQFDTLWNIVVQQAVHPSDVTEFLKWMCPR